MKSYLVYILILCSIASSFAQVGINNPNPEPSSILDLKSYDKGFLVPRMTGQRRKNITGSAHSLMVFDLSESMFYYYDSTHTGAGELKWTSFSPFILRDDDTFSRIVTGGSSTGADTTISFKNAYTHENVRYVGIGTTTPLNTLAVNGNLSVGSVDSIAPINGVYIEGQVKMNSSLTVADTVRASVLVGVGEAPIGGIIMWSGGTADTDLPEGWKLCDGRVYGTVTTPDLSGKFIMASGDRKSRTLNANGTTTLGVTSDTYAVGNGVGFDYVILKENQMPAHTHTGTTNTDGAHNHEFNDYRMNESSNSGDYADGDGTGGSDVLRTTIDGQGAHTHNFTTNSTGSSLSHENRPPYYVLAYIMRVK